PRCPGYREWYEKRRSVRAGSAPSGREPRSPAPAPLRPTCPVRRLGQRHVLPARGRPRFRRPALAWILNWDYLPYVVLALLVERARMNLCNSCKGTFGQQQKNKLAHALDKGDLVDLFQRGHAQADFVECRLTQKPHAFLARRSPNLRRRFFCQNHLSNAIAQVEQFVDRRASAEAGSSAL